jgi:hypothetical protein
LGGEKFVPKKLKINLISHPIDVPLFVSVAGKHHRTSPDRRKSVASIKPISCRNHYIANMFRFVLVLVFAVRL